ncbi:MAG: hypothetical protein KDE03_07330 [Rhodobacteraceae bacterium]|nr:hypothetical protein [Paracoccaceae bacterium]
MEFIANVLLGAGAIGAGIYCLVLSRRLKAFNQLENGMGGAIAVLSAQVDDMTRTLAEARNMAAKSSDTLDEMTGRAEAAARKLELMLATLHDLPESPASDGRRLRVLRRRAETENRVEAAG